MAANSATNGDGLLLDTLKAAPKEDAANGGMVVPPAALKNSAVTTTQEDSAPRMEPEDQLDSGERRLNELGYKQELRREMVLLLLLLLLLLLQGLSVPELVVANCFVADRFGVGDLLLLLMMMMMMMRRRSCCGMDVQTLFKCMAIAFSTMTLFTGIVPLYGSSLMYAGPVGLVWGWVVVTFFTWFVGFAMSEICSSFPVRFFTTIQIWFFPSLVVNFFTIMIFFLWGPIPSLVVTFFMPSWSSSSDSFSCCTRLSTSWSSSSHPFSCCTSFFTIMIFFLSFLLLLYNLFHHHNLLPPIPSLVVQAFSPSWSSSSHSCCCCTIFFTIIIFSLSFLLLLYKLFHHHDLVPLIPSLVEASSPSCLLPLIPFLVVSFFTIVSSSFYSSSCCELFHHHLLPLIPCCKLFHKHLFHLVPSLLQAFSQPSSSSAS